MGRAQHLHRTADDLRQMTAPALLLERARRAPDAVAFRSKALGIYRERTWSQYALMVAHTAKAFAAHGLKAGERIAIMARSEEHTSELQSRPHLVCRLLLEKK